MRGQPPPLPQAVDCDDHVFSTDHKCIFCDMTESVAEDEPRCPSRALLRAMHRQFRALQAI